MGFCTANSIDLVNMTSSGDECARQGRTQQAANVITLPPERAMSGPSQGRRRAA